jgi:hypothetical protein
MLLVGLFVFFANIGNTLVPTVCKPFILLLTFLVHLGALLSAWQHVCTTINTHPVKPSIYSSF